MLKRVANTFRKLKRRKHDKTQQSAAVTPSPETSSGANAPKRRKPTAVPAPDATKSLLWAVSVGQEDTVRQLLREGASPLTRNKAEISVLHIAARDGNEQIVRLLLEAGAVPSAKDPDTGVTPLHRAAERGHEGVVMQLLEAGANMEAKAFNGATPLHEAARGCHWDVVRGLLEFGADAEATNAEGVTAFQIASTATAHESFRHWAGRVGTTTADVGVNAARRGQAASRQPVRPSKEARGLIYNQKDWDEYWQTTMEGLRRDTVVSEPSLEPLPPAAGSTPHRSQAIADAIDSGQLSLKTGFSLLR